MFLDPLGNFWKVLVLLTYIIFLAEVDQIDDRLGGEEKEGIYNFDLCSSLDVLKNLKTRNHDGIV